MYLESLTIKNYRKFRSTGNTICFVKPEVIDKSIENDQTRSVIAPSTTLIIGKNNAGKTTIVNALKMLCNNEQPTASDFNLSYLNELFNKYKEAFEEDPSTTFKDLETPNLEFTLKVKVDFNDEDLMTHLAPFISISEKGDGEPISVCIMVKVVLSEESTFKEEVSKIFKTIDSEGKELENNQRFEKFYALLSKETSVIQTGGNLYQIAFIDSFGDETEKFSLKKLINIKEIKANRHLKEDVLSSVFNKIVAFQFSHDDKSRFALEKSITSINTRISRDVSSKNKNISQVLEKVESSNKVDLRLSGNITYDAVMEGLIKYNFMDGEDHIPEDQFGLGYINLLNIIGEIIHFVDSYEDKSHFSHINLLFIEEPEAFMHPQMQEFFIKRIDNAVIKALDIANAASKGDKTLQCQIAITTHSSHIVNSKIHSSNTFNNLNYLTSINKCTKVVNLTDDAVVSSNDSNANEKLNFLKKHIKYKVSELFFSDAIIFVEGITEETLLNYYLEKDQNLSNYYISIFNINGAHGKLYLPLAQKLSIPSLIVTDLDIKRAKCEKNENHKKGDKCNQCGYGIRYANGALTNSYGSRCDMKTVFAKPSYKQITSLVGRTTTNSTITYINEKFSENSDAKRLYNIKFVDDGNVYTVFQKDPIEGQYATSLEEALILTNYKNDIINDVIKKCKKDIYNEILNYDDSRKDLRENLIYNSYKLQKKLSGSKSDFSNELIFKILSSEYSDDLPKLPNYLEDGLKWLVRNLQANEMPKLNIVEAVIDTEAESNVLDDAEAVTDDA
ncbi:AAA family ATPase [Photobacterium sp. GB-72]|uniref:AAA family ATPase n=1 Tax=Photobacterium sp. GB-72 TaxID=2022105 RepID=UPI000D168421|nr:AAA family ATPase [Photobacterium sp. GB-72]PSV30103.1 ATP-dependent endonuclease [Photobacterium sp. GB-72]